MLVVFGGPGDAVGVMLVHFIPSSFSIALMIFAGSFMLE